MTLRMLRVFLLLLTGYCVCQNTPQNNAAKSPQQCELSDVDYDVYTAVLNGLGGPEDPEESWKGKEILIADVTRVPMDRKSGWGGWGFRSNSKAAPQSDTLADFENKRGSLCTLQAKIGGSQPYRLISAEETEKNFKKRGDGWERFYKKYPQSAGYWGFSRPGYNSTGDEAVLYVSHSCGWLCGTGHLYLVAKQDGKWEVKNRLMLWIS